MGEDFREGSRVGPGRPEGVLYMDDGGVLKAYRMVWDW